MTEKYNWREKFDGIFDQEFNGYSLPIDIKDFIENLLIQILAEMESAPDAKSARHIIKNYLLKDHGK